MEQQQIFKIEEKRFINKQSRKKKVPVYEEKINVQFKYHFQDYLKLAFAKLIPFSRVVIDPKQKLIHGLKQDCDRLKSLCEEELKKWSYKILILKKEIDIDQIDYLLDRQYQAKFYRYGYILKAINALYQYSGLEEGCQQFQQNALNKKTIIIRVNSDYKLECFKKIYQIVADKEKSGEDPIQNNMMKNREQKILKQTKETIVSQQNSIDYYGLLHKNGNKPHQKRHIDCSLSSQLSTSSLSQSFCSLTLTQLDPSIGQDSVRSQNSKVQESLINK